MLNYILDESRLTDEMKEHIEKIENMVKNKQIPMTYPEYMTNVLSIKRFERRDWFIENMGFSLLSWDWLNPICDFLKDKKCLEIMCGSGSLSYALKQKGIDVIATDNFSWNGYLNWNKNKNYWTDIENIDALEAIEKYGKSINVIIISWAYMDDVAYRCLMKMRELNPDCEMIVIGEGEGGCTASDEFFHEIIEIENSTIDKANEYYHRWNGIHDKIMLVK